MKTVGWEHFLAQVINQQIDRNFLIILFLGQMVGIIVKSF